MIFVGYWTRGSFEIFTNHAKNMDLLRNWISTEIVTGIRHTSKKYIDLALEWVMPPAHKQTCYSYVDKMLGNHFEGEESQKPIPWKQWLPWLDPPETPCPWLGTPTWEFQEMESLPCGHQVKMKQAAFTPTVLWKYNMLPWKLKQNIKHDSIAWMWLWCHEIFVRMVVRRVEDGHVT